MQVTRLFTGYVSNLFASAAADKDAWKSKDAALYLITALAVKGKTAALGATATNQLVSISDVFSQQVSCSACLTALSAFTFDSFHPPQQSLDMQVARELQSGANGQPILQADALKFTTTLRSQLPKASLLALFPDIIALLRSESNVVHTYAAILLDRLLTSRVRFSSSLPMPLQQRHQISRQTGAQLHGAV